MTSKDHLQDSLVELMTGSLGTTEQRLTVGSDGSGGLIHIAHADAAVDTATSFAGNDESTFLMSGPPPQNESGVREVCETLAEALRLAEGTRWTADLEREVQLPAWVDWCIRNDSEVRFVQVTRVASESHWARMATEGRATGSVSAADAAAEIWAAIERKLPQQDASTILALDVRHPGLHLFDRFVHKFLCQHAESIRQRVRYAEVWLVGYRSDLTCRVHPTYFIPPRF